MRALNSKFIENYSTGRGSIVFADYQAVYALFENCDFIRKTNGLTTSISYANTISNSYEFEYEKNDVFKNMMEDFLRFVYSESILPRVTIPRGLEVMLIIDKIKEASLKQNWVTVGDQ
jgi:hypothetical protein